MDPRAHTHARRAPRARVRARTAAALVATIALAAMLLAAATPAARAAGWTPITSPGSQTVVNPITDLAWDGTKLWAAWGDDAYDVNVASWNGTTWSTITQPGTGTTSNKMPSLTWDGTKLWAAWNDDTGTVQVSSWNGTTWTGITSPGSVGVGNFSTPDIEYLGSTLYIAYQDSAKNVQVKSWNGSTWTAIASPGGGGTNNSYPDLAWDGTKPWVAYNDASNNAQYKSYSAGVWTAITSPGGGGINTLPTLAFVGNRLYTMREDASHTITFHWWNGQGWTAAPTLGSTQSSWAYSTVLWNGSAFWDARTTDPDTINVAYAADATPPAPTAPAQYLADGTTSIPWGGWTSAGATSNLVLKVSMTDPDAGEQLTPWVEVQPNGTPFSATCGQVTAGVTFTGTPVAATTAGAAVTGSVVVTGLANNQTYHWRACTVDQWGFPSTWATPGNSPDLRIDTTVPTAALSTPANAATVTQAPLLTATYTDGAPSSPGRLNVQVCSDAACTVVVRTGSTSLGIASGATGSWTPATLALGTWYWRVQPVDSAGNTGAWTATRSFTSAASITVSGTASENESGAVWSGCDGFTPNVAVSVNGAAALGGTCSPTDGSWSIGVNVVLADRPLVAFFNDNLAGNDGATYTRNADTSSNIGGLSIVDGRTWIRSESVTATSGGDIDVFDSTQDPDIPVASNGRDITVTGELHVGAGSSLQSTGNVTTTRLHLAGTYVAAPTEVLTITGSGSGACTAATPRPFCMESGSSFAPMDGQVTRFTSTANLALEPTTYRRLELQPGAAGSPTYTVGTTGGGTLTAGAVAIGDGTNPVTVTTAATNASMTVAGDLTIAAGATLTGAGSGTITAGGHVTGAGTFTAPAGTVDHRVAGVGELLGTTSGTANWSFDSLRVDDLAPGAWSGSGMVTHNGASSGNDRIQSVTHDAAGNIYACGWTVGATGEDMVIRRYTPAGALDTSWAGGTGMVSYNSSGVLNDECWDVVVDAAGRVYMGGTAKVADASGSDIVVRRYTPAGVLDTAWGTSGMVTYDTGANQTDSITQLAIDANGGLYVSGRQQSNGIDWVIRKYTPTGLLDTSWASGTGTVTWNSSGAVEDELIAIALQPDGKLIASGYSGAAGAFDWKIRRYTTAGALDVSWAGTGTLTYAPSAWNDIPSFRSTLVDTSGNVYIGGYVSTSATNQDLVVRKYDSTGTIIAGWGTGGMVTYNSGANTLDAAYQMSLDADGRLVVPGYQQTNGFDWVLLRYTAAGQLDTTFGNGTGLVTYNSGGVSTDSARASFIDPSGNIVVAGYNATNAGDWAIRSYDPGGNLRDGTAGFAGSSVPSAGGTGSITVGTQLVVGQSGDPAVTTLNLEANDRVVDIDGSLSISSKGAVNASSTTPLTIARDFTNNGTFTPNTGAVTFDSGAASNLQYSAATTFSAFNAVTPGKLLRFDSVDQTNVTGVMTVNGQSCANPVSMFSDTAGVQFRLNSTNAGSTFNFAYIGDSNAVAVKTANSSTGATNNTGWTINGGGCAPIFGQNADDTNAQGGTPQSTAITRPAPHLSWINRTGGAKDRQRVQVVNDTLNNVVALWHLDNNGTDASGNGFTMTLGGAPNTPTYVAGATNFGQALQFDGVNDSASGPVNAAFNLANNFTADVWFKTTAYGSQVGNSVIFQKASGGCTSNCNFDLELDETNNQLCAGVFANAVAQFRCTGSGTSPALMDGNWHYAAFVIDSANTLYLYVDGLQVGAPKPLGGPAVTTSFPATIGSTTTNTTSYAGAIDDPRVLNRALTAGEILGYYRTNRPHNTTMWDSDVSDTGVALTSCSDMTRCADVVYGATGSPIALPFNGARYYARSKLRLGAGAWSAFSDWDWFETMSAVTISLPSGPSAPLGSSMANADATATTTIDIYCNNATGYTLSATAPSDTEALVSGADAIAPWSGTPATPTSWGSGIAGGFGLTVLSATGGKDTARWGTGSVPNAFATLKYAGLQSSTPTTLHAPGSCSASTDSIAVGYRADVGPLQPPGAYGGSVTYTAIANP